MWPIVTDQVAYLSVTVVSPAKTAEPIDILFGLRIQMGPRNHELDGVQIAPSIRAILGERICLTTLL